MIVCEVARQPQRNSRKPRRLRREIKPPGVGAAHNYRKFIKRGIVEPVVLDKSIKAAQFSNVRKLDVRYVIGNGLVRSGGSMHGGRGDVEKLRAWVNKSAYQPRASDAVDLRAFARHPTRGRTFGFGGDFTARSFP